MKVLGVKDFLVFLFLYSMTLVGLLHLTSTSFSSLVVRVLSSESEGHGFKSQE